MSRGLKSLVAAFHRRLGKDKRFGMAVVHFKNPADSSTWKLVGFDPVASRLVGSSVPDFLASPVIERHSKENFLDLISACREIHASGGTRLVGHVHPRTKAGGREFYSVTAIALAGNRVGLLFENETILLNTTQALVDAKIRFEEMSQAVKAIQCCADPYTLEFTQVSEEAREILGYWTERWTHELCFWKKHMHADDWEMVRQQCAEVARDGESRQFDCRMTAADGRELWLHVSMHREKLPSGATQLSGIMMDVTERKRAEEASRKVALQVLRQSETERKWLSQELDNGLGMHLAALRTNLASMMPPDSPLETEIQQKVRDCIELVQICTDELCSVSFMLRPPLLDECGLAAALEWYTTVFSKWSDIVVEMDIADDLPRLDPAHEIVLFRFAQECIKNVYRHAGTRRVALRLRLDEKEIVMEVEDPGTGIPADTLRLLESGGYGAGIGLTKLRERIRGVNGTMQIHASNVGTIVCARIPRQAALPPSETNLRSTSLLGPRDS
jgi:PAS domain S-box-containing protein